MTSILIALTRLPRVFLLGAIALNFGISNETDTFFLIYSISLFLVASISYTNEVLAPGPKSFTSGMVASILALIGTFFFTESYLALFLIAYVIFSSIASTSVGLVNRNQDYKILGASVVPYLFAVPIAAFIPENIYVLSSVLVGIELVRLIVLKAYITQIFQNTENTGWNYSLSMLFAVVIGGASTVIVKLFATHTDPGTVTKLAYTFGAIFPIANALSYGATVDKINRISFNVSLYPAVLAALAVSTVSLSILLTPFWFSSLSIPIAVFTPAIPLAVLSSIQRSYFVKHKDNKELLKASSLSTVVVCIGSFIALPYGLLGLLSVVLVAKLLYLGYLSLKLRQHNYFGYNIVKAVPQEVNSW